MELAQKKCKPCEGGIPALGIPEVENYLKQLNNNWKVEENKRITREWKFINFVHTMDFVNKVAQLAEEEGHHPVLHIGYGTCTVELWTHAIDGLSENDFILAAKIDRIK
jgi:4a-hydroxytetrahydrobiopterin dehydratase